MNIDVGCKQFMGTKEICAVVATYNRKELLKKCIKDILSQKNAECNIIVIDNGSTDGTEELFQNELKAGEVDYFNTNSNLGSAGAQAIGIKMAVQAGYKYIWLMDDDVFPKEDALYELLKVDRELNGNWGILSSVAYWTDGSLCNANIQKKDMFHFMKGKDYRNKYTNAFMVSAASMFIKSDAVRIVGLPIADYFFYTDDYEFSSRIGSKFPVYVVPASIVTHAMKENIKANIVKDPPEKMYRYEHLFRNDVHCYKQFGFPGYAYLVLKFIYTFMMIVIKEKGQKQIKLGILINGYREGVSFNPQIEMIDI